MSNYSEIQKYFLFVSYFIYYFTYCKNFLLLFYNTANMNISKYLKSILSLLKCNKNKHFCLGLPKKLKLLKKKKILY